MPRLPTLVRTTVVAVVAAFLLPGGRPRDRGPPRWVRDIDRTIDGHDVSVAIAVRGNWLYRHAAWKQRTPASNQKLLLSMALLHRTSLRTRVRTQVFAKGATTNGVLRGDLWVVGHGDPEVDRATMTELARALDASGIERVRGRVMGATTGFLRDWWAPGWQDYFPRDYIALPTRSRSRATRTRAGCTSATPSGGRRAPLTKRLRARGIPVTMDAGAGSPPTGLRRVVTRRSASFEVLLRHMNRRSRNFHAEVLGKWLGGLVHGGAGSIAKGARAIETFAGGRGVTVVANDSSGLSYGNRVRPQDLVALLRFAQQRPWGRAFHGLGNGRPGHARGSPRSG